ncbi:hypothetical protein [Gimesia chilikensis]|uniref:hypothetical protein n=1 Tax=Gimesia chilikensis TaxID=2605989 RepID=UPI00118D3067|nr:hypothetical protein [Gimesia chilikensis]QDT88281.1 hypothetical protein MalM14_59780 [Gimesia chilikensis]
MIDHILKQLEDIEARFEIIEEDDDDFDDDLCRIPEMSEEEYLEFLEARGQTEFGKVWRVYRGLMFDLVDEYLNCTPECRLKIRKLISKLSNVKFDVCRLVEEQGWLIKDRSDENLLRRLIGLLSISDLGYSLATLFTVNNLYGAASNAKIDIQPIMSEIASISSDEAENIDSDKSTKEFLETFKPFYGDKL